MQIQAKIGGILYDHGGKMGSNYLDLELGKEFRIRVQVPSFGYKSLAYSTLYYNKLPVYIVMWSARSAKDANDKCFIYLLLAASLLLSARLCSCQQPASDVASRFVVVTERLHQILTKFHI